jgi:hypothetical protein
MANSGPKCVSDHDRQGASADIPLKIESKSVIVICIMDWRGLSF